MWNWNRYSAATLNGKPPGVDATLPFIITENGVDVPGESNLPLHEGNFGLLIIPTSHPLHCTKFEF
jgi:hypothetical protein